MCKEFLDKFIRQIEELSKTCDKNEFVVDKLGTYLKYSYLDSLIFEAKELIKYGEYRIALENMLDNLYEVSIMLDENIIDLARQAFGDKKNTEIERILTMLTKK